MHIFPILLFLQIEKRKHVDLTVMELMILCSQTHGSKHHEVKEKCLDTRRIEGREKEEVVQVESDPNEDSA